MSFLGRTDYNVGSDVSVTIRERNGGGNWTAEQLGHATEMEATFDDKEETVEPFTNGGQVLHMTIPKGVTGHMSFVRMDATLDKLLINKQQKWFNDGVSLSFDIQVQIRRRDGASVDTYLISDCAFSKGKLLSVKGTAPLDQGFSFRGRLVNVTTS